MSFMTKEWTGQEAFRIDGFHHVEFYVGNAKQAAYYYRAAFGFDLYAYKGPETGCRTHVTYVLKQGHVYILLTTPLSSSHPAAEWLKKHGDSVHDIALSVPDPSQAFKECIKRGGKEAYAPREEGTYVSAGIRTYGETIHSFISDREFKGHWAPGFVELKQKTPLYREPVGLAAIDHIVGNVAVHEMNRWSKFYEDVFGFMTFVEFDENDISTKYSALKSKVVRSKNWLVKLPLNEPAKGLKKSQIEEYLDFNEGAGVQHIALYTKDIVKTVTALRTNGVEFLQIPDSYYDSLTSRVGELDEDIEMLKKNGILVDRDQDGYLLQLFTKPIEDRPTFFFEIIERKGALGFGQGNFQALFESIEREQGLRGNL